MDFFATAAKGTEGALRDELRELRLAEVRADRGGVHFEGSFEDGWRACLGSRVAVRVLAWRSRFLAADEQALYDGVRDIDWSPFFGPKTTLAVKASCRSSRLTHTQFIAQKTKDAVVDQLRDRFGARPSVDLDDPDVSIVVHLVKDEAEVYLDLSGAPLHLRGYRSRIGTAPLKETLAAALVRLSGWNRKDRFVDPMCGAGTIATEAAAWARRMAPGISRAFGFERWAYFDEGMARRMGGLREEARAQVLPEGPEVVASDIDAGILDLARANAADAGVKVHFEQKDVRESRPGKSRSVFVTNPPYGERLDAELTLYRGMGEAFARHHGDTVAILSGAPEIEKAMPWPTTRWLALFNGNLPCRLLVYDVR